MATMSPKDGKTMPSKFWEKLINLEVVPSKTKIKTCSDERPSLSFTGLC